MRGGGKWMCSLSDVKEKKFFAGENFKHGGIHIKLSFLEVGFKVQKMINEISFGGLKNPIASVYNCMT